MSHGQKLSTISPTLVKLASKRLDEGVVHSEQGQLDARDKLVGEPTGMAGVDVDAGRGEDRLGKKCHHPLPVRATCAVLCIFVDSPSEDVPMAAGNLDDSLASPIPAASGVVCLVDVAAFH